MLYNQIFTASALVFTLVFSYDDYRKGKMSPEIFKLVWVSEIIGLFGIIYLILVR